VGEGVAGELEAEVVWNEGQRDGADGKDGDAEQESGQAYGENG